MRVDILGFDLADYVVSDISETVDKAGGLAAIAEQQTEIQLIDNNNKFSRMFSGINYKGDPVTVSDDYGILFDGEIVSAKKTGNTFTVYCRSLLAKYLRSVLSYEITGTTPANAIAGAISLFGLSSKIDMGTFSVAHSRYLQRGIYVNLYAAAAQGMTLAGAINQVGDLGSCSFYTRRGIIYCSYPEFPDTSDRTLTGSDFLDIPALSWQDTAYTGYSVDFIGSGEPPLPAVGGDTTGTTWTQSTGAGSPVQALTEHGAHALGALRVARDGKIKRIVTGRVNIDNVPVYTDDVYNLSLPSLSVSGLFRVQKYTRNKNNAIATFEEVFI